MMKENEQEMQHGHDGMPIAMDARESETLDDIDAEYRGLCKERPLGVDLGAGELLCLLDRVRAAWKRQMSQSWLHREMAELVMRHEKEMSILKQTCDGADAWGVIARIGDAIQKKMETSPQSVTANECAIMNACHRALAERPQTVLSRIETLGRLQKELEFCEDNVKRGVGFTPFGLEKHCELLREIVVALETHEEGVSR